MKILLSFLIVLLGVVVIGSIFRFICYLEEKRGIDKDFVLSYACLDITFIIVICYGVFTVYNSLFVN